MHKILIVLVALSLACGGDGDATGPTSVVGTYDLVLVDGEPLPIMSTSTEPVEIVSSGFIILRGDGTFSYNERGFSNSEDGEGTYQLDGNSLTFTTLAGDSPNASEVWRARIGGDQINVTDHDNRAYVRR